MLRSTAVFASYEHFLGIAARAQWDEARDRPERRRARLAARRRSAADRARRGLLRRRGRASPSTCTRSPTARAAACFAAQQRDEARHARFFARYAAAVGLDDPRAHVSPEFLELFEVRLPEAAAGAPGEAVGLYHMVLEGVVFTAGQLALLDLRRRPPAGAARRGPSWSCATSAGTSASAPAAWPISTTTRRRSWRRASGPRRCGRPSTRSGSWRGCAAACARCGGSRRVGVKVGGVELEMRGDRRRRARARLPARGARLGRAVARLPGAAGGGDRPARADLLARGARAVRRAGGAADAALHARRGARRAARAAARRAGSSAPVLVGHSDGGSIALIHASAHPVSRARPARAARVRRGSLGGEHRRRRARRSRPPTWGSAWAATTATPSATFRLWNDIWLAPEFRSWNIEDVLGGVTAPALLIQGEHDQYGTLAQIEAIERGVAARCSGRCSTAATRRSSRRRRRRSRRRPRSSGGLDDGARGARSSSRSSAASTRTTGSST